MKYSYTCPICEVEWEYVSSTQYLDFFRAGVLGKAQCLTADVRAVAAYEHGKSCRVMYKGKSGRECEGVRYDKEEIVSVHVVQEDVMIRKKKQQKEVSFDAMLGQTVVSVNGSKSKKSNPVIVLDEELSGELKIFIEKKKEMKKAEAEMRVAEQPVISECLERMDVDGLKDDFHSSYDVKMTDGTIVKFISVDKFNLSQEPEAIGALRATLGEEVFNKEVVKRPTVVLKAEVFESEEMQKKLMCLMGEEFPKFFETSIRYGMREGFDERMYRIAGGEKSKLIMIRALVGKNKPYLK